MRTGKLKHLVQIQKKINSKDSYGQIEPTWATVATVYADIRPIGGRERLAAFAFESKITHTVAVRYSEDLSNTMLADEYRIKYGTRTLLITAGRNMDEKNRWIVYDCEEGPHDG